MDESYCVYIHTFPNGKKYVGQCREPATSRWKGGSGYARQKLIHNAILKFGWDNITHEIALSGISRKAAYAKEIELIKALNTNGVAGGFGYNMSDGGESGANGYRHTTAMKAHFSELNKGEQNQFFGKKHTDESRRKISAVHKGKKVSDESRMKMSLSRRGENHPMFGRKQSNEVKRKLSEINLGEKNPNYGLRGRDCPHAKLYQCVETGVVYKSLSEIKTLLELIDASHVSAACLGKTKKAYGYHWQFPKNEPHRREVI